MDDDLILKVLQKATTAAVAASSTPKLPVQYIGLTFAKPTDQKYLEVVFLPNNRDDFWGSEKNYAGMYRLILHWPIDGEGPYGPMAVIKSICSYFTKDRWLDGVKITQEPDAMGLLVEGGEALYPSSLKYSSHR